MTRHSDTATDAADGLRDQTVSDFGQQWTYFTENEGRHQTPLSSPKGRDLGFIMKATIQPEVKDYRLTPVADLPPETSPTLL